MLESLLSSDLTLVVFCLTLGGLVGMFGERMRRDRDDPSRHRKD